MSERVDAAASRSFDDMREAVESFHRKHRLREGGSEDLPYRVALMAEELGEISACITKGRGVEDLSEECADLLILVMGTAIAAEFDLERAFWDKMSALEQRQSRIIDGRVRVSQFDRREDD